MLIAYIRRNIQLAKAKKNWRKKNPHNFTRINSIFDHSLVEIGDYTYGTINISSSSNINKVRIGRFCSIADNVVFMVNNEHPLKLFSTYPFENKLFSGIPEAISKGDIIVGDDVWIGNNVTILSGVSIGQGAVIGTGAVVTKDIPPYSIVAGVPAKVIKYRFPEDIIKVMKNIDYSKIDKDFIQIHKDAINRPVTNSSDLAWLPYKKKDYFEEDL